MDVPGYALTGHGLIRTGFSSVVTIPVAGIRQLSFGIGSRMAAIGCSHRLQTMTVPVVGHHIKGPPVLSWTGGPVIWGEKVPAGLRLKHGPLDIHYAVFYRKDLSSSGSLLSE